MTRDTSRETVERQGASAATALHMVLVATLGGRTEPLVGRVFANRSWEGGLAKKGA